jgi:hypothetical protein
MHHAAIACLLIIFTAKILKADPLPPEHLRIFRLENSCATFAVSGTLQEGDMQYVHDIYARETGEKLGTVAMRWGSKYGWRYGGCGYFAEGVSAEWGGEGKGVRVCLPASKSFVQEIVVVPRLSKIVEN